MNPGYTGLRDMPHARVPLFAQDFPHTPELDALVETFARGDYADVRERASTLAASTDDVHVRASALMLIDRTRPEPLAVALLGLAAALLVALGGYWMAYGRPVTPSVTAPTSTSR